MSVAVVNIREMWVFVHHSRMTMPMVMRLAIVPVEIVRVLVVFVMGARNLGLADRLLCGKLKGRNGTGVPLRQTGTQPFTAIFS